MKGGKSHAKDDNMLGLMKITPETKEAKRVFMQLIVLSDSEEENVHPSRGSRKLGISMLFASSPLYI